MEYWEFLLQKEGDRSWLPLESPDVEILEGRYRVVARSSRANTSVDVRIMHQTVDETPPKRRLQKRSGRTNQDGLMVVFPFTRLQPGLWEVRCSGDILSDFFGKNWQYSVRMQVLPQEHECGDDWEPDWQQLTDNEANEPSSEAIASPPELQPEVAVIEVNPKPPESEPAIAPVSAAVSDVPQAQSDPEAHDEPIDHPALATIYSIEQLQHLAEQIVQTGNAAAPIASLLTSDAEPPASTSAEPLLAAPIKEPTSTETEAPEETVEPVTPEPASAAIAEVSATPVQLTLDQTAYIARWGRPFTVSGFVERAQQSEGTGVGQLTAQTSWRGEVYVCLRDPQSAQVLVETRQAIATQVLPYPFSCTVEIPLDCRTRLLLGEVTLHPANTAQDAAALPTQEFTITADLDELLEAIAADIPEDDLLDLPVESPPPPVAPPAEEATPDLTYLNLSFLDVADASQRRSFHFQSSAGDPLPPQIYKPAPSEVPKPLDLPIVQKPQPQVPTTPSVVEEPALAVDPAETSDFDELTTDLELEHDEFLELGDATAVAAIEIDPDSELDLEIEMDADSENAIADENEAAATDPAFQSLKLQDRFWSRLNALATDAELSSWLQEDEPEETQPEPSEAAIAPDLAPSEPELPEPTTSALVMHPKVRRPEDEWIAQEIVVDDEPDIATQTPATPTETQSSALLAEDEPVPTPKLEVPAGELVSGKPITVRVRIPNLSTRIYVKFWITDRQTRSLLDGPRWLVDFTPTGLGDMEATTQLTVPFGSLEIQFEAIAVEMATQRESHKITAERMVVPPDAPTLPIQEWD